jgi:peptidoglycan/LPS O-acetylase OafA/YrhL
VTIRAPTNRILHPNSILNVTHRIAPCFSSHLCENVFRVFRLQTTKTAGIVPRDSLPYPSDRIPELDGLRGVAILLVIVCHYIGNAAELSSGPVYSRVSRFAILGAHGVDLFFVLSGFLIGGILLRARNSPSYFRPFYVRRFYRIIPIYYVWLAVCGILILVRGAWGAAGAQVFQLATPFWIYPLFLQNFFYTETTFQLFFFAPLWSLAVEEQFYLLIPFLVRYLNPARLVQVLSAVLLVAPLLRWALVAKISWGNAPAHQWMICRADSLGAGVLLANVWASPRVKEWLCAIVRRLYGILLCVLTISGVVLFAALVHAPFSGWLPRLGRESLAFFFSFVIILTLANPEGMVAAALRNACLRWFGKVSYSTYIMHWAVSWVLHALILHSLPMIDNWKGVAVTLLALGVTMAIAELSWRFFENPLIHRGHMYYY